jgi:two-component system chemotaxis response regulator CheY
MKTCLVVDDSKVIRMVAKRIMNEFGFETEEAEDGEEALQKCLKSMPDLVLLDWNMPVMDGLEFLLELRKSPGGSAPKVVFCTTENDLEHITEAIQNGADEYIMKPFDSEIVQSKLEQIGIM